jgi:multidrug efflux system membrane fusion protein
VGDRVQVASGLQIGEKVITEGADRLRDGARVLLPGDTPRAPAGSGGGRRRARRLGAGAALVGAAGGLRCLHRRLRAAHAPAAAAGSHRALRRRPAHGRRPAARRQA